MPYRPQTDDIRRDEELRVKSQKIMNATADPLEKLRCACLSRGVTGILTFGKMFRRMDDDGSQALNADEFMKGLAESGIAVSEEDSKEIFKAFDKDESGNIDYDEFLLALRPSMNTSRRKLVDLAFEKLDASGDGIVNLADLKGVYSVTRHPKFLSGEMTEDQILATFIRNFEGGTTVDGKVTREEFYDYYAGLSAAIDQDVYFDLMMRNAWGIK